MSLCMLSRNMPRSREHNEALAGRCASLFRSLLRPVTTNRLPAERIELFDYALTHLDRKHLWDLYLHERCEREDAKLEWWALLATLGVPEVERSKMIRFEAEMPDRARTAFERVAVHAFLARAAITPASALRGRAVPWLENYLGEGLEYAAFVVASGVPEKRKALIELWSSAIPNLGNLDRGQEPLYVPSDAT